jgi:hypothetical protein
VLGLAGLLGRLPEQVVQVGELLEVLGLEVVGPQHPQVMLDQLATLLLDDDGALPEQRVVGGVVLLDDLGHRLGLDPGLGRVVHATRQVAVGVDHPGGPDPCGQALGDHAHRPLPLDVSARRYYHRYFRRTPVTRDDPAMRRTTAVVGGLAMVAVVAAALAVRRAQLEPMLVKGGSMRPTLGPGQRIAVAPLARPPARGDLVVLRSPRSPGTPLGFPGPLPIPRGTPLGFPGPLPIPRGTPLGFPGPLRGA